MHMTILLFCFVLFLFLNYRNYIFVKVLMFYLSRKFSYYFVDYPNALYTKDC